MCYRFWISDFRLRIEESRLINSTSVTFRKIQNPQSKIRNRNTLAAVRVSSIFAIAIVLSCCSNSVNSRLSTEMPQKILWAWERPEDLKFIDPNEFGVAFLAQTISLENDRVSTKPRRQPLDIAPGTYLIAVTRIETNKETVRRPKFDLPMIGKTAALIKNTLALPDVKAVQIDFDAVVSERAFYRKMVTQLRDMLDKDSDKSVRVPLTMTSLASWCTGDAWFNDFPVDEAVPMVFQMGADSDKIKTYLRNGSDWTEPLCRGSYGISLDDALNVEMKPNRRIYYFKNSAWTNSDLVRLNQG